MGRTRALTETAGKTGTRSGSVRTPATVNGKSKKPATKKPGRKKATGTAMKTRTKPARSAPAGRLAKKGAGARRGATAAAPQVRVAVRSLDPFEKCGPNTSVQLLYRVDESVEGRSTPHLVFFDHHGWYCEHGRTCPAVGHAKKYNGQIARVS
jgi:hypothetical protein